MVALWLQKLLEKIKLPRMSGIPPQYLELKARYRANIKNRDQSWSNTFVLSRSFGTDNDNWLQVILVVACSFIL